MQANKRFSALKPRIHTTNSPRHKVFQSFWNSNAERLNLNELSDEGYKPQKREMQERLAMKCSRWKLIE